MARVSPASCLHGARARRKEGSAAAKTDRQQQKEQEPEEEDEEEQQGGDVGWGVGRGQGRKESGRKEGRKEEEGRRSILEVKQKTRDEQQPRRGRGGSVHAATRWGSVRAREQDEQVHLVQRGGRTRARARAWPEGKHSTGEL